MTEEAHQPGRPEQQSASRPEQLLPPTARDHLTGYLTPKIAQAESRLQRVSTESSSHSILAGIASTVRKRLGGKTDQEKDIAQVADEIGKLRKAQGDVIEGHAATVQPILEEDLLKAMKWQDAQTGKSSEQKAAEIQRYRDLLAETGRTYTDEELANMVREREPKLPPLIILPQP